MSQQILTEKFSDNFGYYGDIRRGEVKLHVNNTSDTFDIDMWNDGKQTVGGSIEQLDALWECMKRFYKETK